MKCEIIISVNKRRFSVTCLGKKGYLKIDSIVNNLRLRYNKNAIFKIEVVETSFVVPYTFPGVAQDVRNGSNQWLLLIFVWLWECNLSDRKIDYKEIVTWKISEGWVSAL